MAKYEFRFVITGIELPEHVQEHVSRAIAEAGALALGDLNPPRAAAFPIGPNIWWRGIPPEEVVKTLEQLVREGTQGPEGGA